MHLFWIQESWYHNPRMYANHCSKGWFLLLSISDIVCSSQADLALSEFLSFYNTSVRERKTSFESFQKKRERLDDSCVKETNIRN